ncbi:MAG: hypothetical protein NT075_33055 [Chloroflexi bacterium]|nr:hypothetical protein [Chloroflexota bacterium]
MSGSNVSYNLRPNKFVERQLFIELLRILYANDSPESYAYISMGGLQLEDHKLVHHQLGLKTLISIEADSVIHKRQEFNRRPHFVECRNEKTGDFITNFDAFIENHPDKRLIIWFDYAAANKRIDQIIEYRSLLSKLTSGDTLKITINANPATLGERRYGESSDDMLIRRTKKLEEQLHDYLPSPDIISDQVTGTGLPLILCQVIRRASLLAFNSNRTLQPVPVSIFCYQDEQHQMLTSTVNIVETAKVEEFKSNLSKKGWEFLPKDWTDITRIKVPNLSVKERLHLEQKLFSDTNAKIHSDLPFRFDADEVESLKTLEEYARHYRRYPSYFQVIL